MKIIVVHDPGSINSRLSEKNCLDSYHNKVTKSIAFALDQLGHDAEICEANSGLENQLRRLEPDLVFNTSIRRLNGSEYAFAPEIFQKMGIPFTGPTAFACSNAYDKQRSIEILEKTGLNTPKAVTFLTSDGINIPVSLNYPLFVKPLKGGCSKGISSQSIIYSRVEVADKIRNALDAAEGPVIVEEFLPGREFTVGIIGNRPPRILNILEFIFKEGELPFRSYSRKMVKFEIEDEVKLANLNTEVRFTVENLALSAFKALEGRDYARIDIRVDAKGNPAVLEVNAIPNLEPATSSFGLMAKYAGISFTGLIELIVSCAMERYSQKLKV